MSKSEKKAVVPKNATAKQKYGIQETSQVIAFLAYIGTGAGHAMKNGVLNAKVLGAAQAAFINAPAAFSGLSKVPAELKDLSTEETKQLVSQFIREFNIPQERAEAFIEAALQALPSLVKIARLLV